MRDESRNKSNPNGRKKIKNHNHSRCSTGTGQGSSSRCQSRRSQGRTHTQLLENLKLAKCQKMNDFCKKSFRAVQKNANHQIRTVQKNADLVGTFGILFLTSSLPEGLPERSNWTRPQKCRFLFGKSTL